MHCETRPDLNKKFIESNCLSCRHASGSKTWCCKWGMWLVINAKTGKSITARALSFADEYRKWALAGFPKRSDTEVTAIKEVCSQCEHVAYGKGMMCRVCGCFLDIKILWETTECQLGQW